MTGRILGVDSGNKASIVGGIVGQVPATTGAAVIKDSMVDAYIQAMSTGANNIGGIVGNTAAANVTLTIQGNYSEAYVENARSSNNFAGGIIGNIQNNAGSVKLSKNVANNPLITGGTNRSAGDYRVGGIVANITGGDTVKSFTDNNWYAPYFATDTRPQDQARIDPDNNNDRRRIELAGSFTAATANQLKNSSFYSTTAGWDFAAGTGTWVMRNGAPDLQAFAARGEGEVTYAAINSMVMLSDDYKQANLPSGASHDFDLYGMKNETVSFQIAAKADLKAPLTVNEFVDYKFYKWRKYDRRKSG